MPAGVEPFTRSRADVVIGGAALGLGCVYHPADIHL